MPRLMRAALGITSCVLVGGCFKLNPEFSLRVEEGLQVLFVFDEHSCQPGRGTVEPLVGDEELLLSNEPCTPCTAEGLRIDSCEATVESRASLELGSGDAFTIESWVSMGGQDDDERMLGLGSDVLLIARPNHTVAFLYESESGIQMITGTGPGDDTGPWHFAVAHDGLTTRLFIDGVQVGSPLEMDLPPLGARSLTIAGDALRPWTGTVHLLAIYERALDIDEYLVNHEAGPTGQGGS